MKEKKEEAELLFLFLIVYLISSLQLCSKILLCYSSSNYILEMMFLSAKPINLL